MEGQLDALASSRVVLDGGCVGFDQNGTFVVIVWPSGTSWDGERGVIRTRDGIEIRIGDEVSLGGGSVPVSEFPFFPVNGPEIRESVLTCELVDDGSSAWLAGDVVERPPAP